MRKNKIEYPLEHFLDSVTPTGAYKVIPATGTLYVNSPSSARPVYKHTFAFKFFHAY